MPPPAPKTCISCSLHGEQCFCDLPSQALTTLEAIGTTIRLGPREVVKREGYAADRVFIICHGRVKLTAASAEGKLLILRIVGPGEVVGLAAVVGGTSYRITAETLTAAELKVVPRDKFLPFMRSFPDASLNTAEAISRAYDTVVLSAKRLALSTTAASKLASTLLDWAHSEHANGQPANDFCMPLTHEELACMAGLSRETVTRLLARFRKESLLIQQGDRMTLLQPQRLQALCS